MPLLFHWQLWTGPRELTFAVLASAFGLSLQALMRVALAAPPLLPARTRARIDALRADAAAALARLPWLPLAIVVLAVLRHAIYFSIVTIRNHYNLQTAGYDLGIENNLVWNAAHWNLPLFKTSVIGGANATHLGYHETYISYLIALPYRLCAAPRDAAGVPVDPDRQRGASAVRLRAPPPGRVDRLLRRPALSLLRARCTGRTCTTSITCRSRRFSCGRRWRCSRRAAIAGRWWRSC